MDFNQEKFISNFIENQFPRFYQEDGPDFILFVKAYYEWLETSGAVEGDGNGGPIREARELLTYRDIDSTIEKFLEYFQKKYLYGIPFNIIANKRFLLKHILDVYRSKGTIQCYRLLFKLIYNEDVDIYLPSIDMLRVSDGTWFQPRYLEVTQNSRLGNYVGKIIVGTSSQTKAMVENYIQESIDRDIINILYISNIYPQGGQFIVGEKLILESEVGSVEAVSISPTLLGSLDSVDIINGGQGFNVGDIVKIAHRDPTTNELSSHGIDGFLRVTDVGKGQGGLNFDIVSGGFGFTANSLNLIYRNLSDTTGNGASFSLFAVSNTYNIDYNTDIIYDYGSIQIGASSYGFPGNTSANSSFAITENLRLTAIYYSGTPTGYNNNDIITVKNNDGGANASVTFTTNSTGGALSFTIANTGRGFANQTSANIQITNSTGGSASGNNNVSIISVLFSSSNSALSFSNQIFGTLSSLSNIKTGTNYTLPADVFVRSTQLSKQLTGNVSYTTSSANVNGTSTKFTEVFANGDVIYLQANSSLSTSAEQQIIRQVVNNTVIVLYGKPTYSSTSSAIHKAAPVILPSQFATYDPYMVRNDATINGLNDNITAVPSSGNNIVSKVVAINSGKAYVEGELVKIYLYGALTTPEVKSIGSGYSNGDVIIFAGGGTSASATGFVTTYSNSSINYVTLTYAGSGYTSLPKMTIKSTNGVGAVLSTTISEFNTFSEVSGRVVKKSLGSGQGYWTTTRGFLNSDKYIQDSYYYQDYSYEVRVPLTLDKYKNILYNTFHVAGTELFGQFQLADYISSNLSIIYEQTSASTYIYPSAPPSLRADSTNITIDNDFYTVDALDPFTIFANTSGFSNTADVLLINNANTYFSVNDYVYYQVPTNNTAIASLTANTYYYVSFANNISIALSSTKGGSNVDIVDNRTTNPSEDHSIFVVQKA